jgi:hypothetical protein
MTDFDLRGGRVIEVGLETVVFDDQLSTSQERHDGGFTDTSVSYDKDGLLVFVVDGDGSQSVVDESLQAREIDGIGLVI